MKHNFLALLQPFLLISMVLTCNAYAEKNDANQPINVEADQFHHDNLKKIQTISGNVILTRGTLSMKAGNMILKEDAQGNQFATLFAAPGGLATFRQRRDGGDFWVEGQAERIEYDSKIELIKLFSKAKLKRLDGTKPTEVVDGEYISYDGRTEFFNVNNTPTSESKPGAGRIKIVIQPRTEIKGN